MDQLIMRWNNGGTLPDMPDFGEFSLRSFDGSDTDIEKWLDVVQYGLTEKREDAGFFASCMLSHKNLEFDKIFMVEHEGDAAATLTVICDYDKKEGYIHMVGCKPQYRGRGLGRALCVLSVRTLIISGMKTAYLTTDDFRIPAIKSYLRAGFFPDLSTEDFAIRWEKIFSDKKNFPADVNRKNGKK